MVTKFVLNIIETIISVCVSLVRCECLHVWAGVCYSSCLCLHMFSLSLYCRCLVLSLRIEGMRFWRWFSRRNDLKSLTVGWTGLQSSSQVRSSRSMAFVRLLRAVPGEDRVGEGGSGDWGLGWWCLVGTDVADSVSVPSGRSCEETWDSQDTSFCFQVSPPSVTMFLESRYFWMVSTKILSIFVESPQLFMLYR